ncbi:MAG: hypothetical protein HC853_06100 [Anaerolineae bacterium]|nr:hypothetical protein [Anaerolineae bacterium]
MKTAKQLQHFRRQCEKVAGVPSAAIHVPLLTVLADVCHVLKLSKKQTQKVVGKQGSVLLQAQQKHCFAPTSRPVIYKPRSRAN